MKLKKLILTAAMSLVMVVGMSVTAFAADIGTGVATTNDNQITVPKGVTFINELSGNYYGPGITYTYTLAPATVAAGTTVTDANNHSTTVNAGPAAGLTLDASSITFAATDTFASSSAGTESEKDIEMSVDLTKFSKPGVYRYVLTDTTAKADLYAAGITRDDNYQAERYIDVFITRDSATGDFKVSGYALKLTNDSTTASSTKDPGYVSESTAEDGTTADTDRYKTYNVSVNKNVTGAMGDVEHMFPFAINVSNQGKGYYAGHQSVTPSATTATSLSTALKHGQTYTILGLSPKAQLSVVETNDTTDLYTVSVTNLDNGNTIAVTENASAKTYTIAQSAVSTYDTANSASSVAAVGAKTDYENILYTNNLEEVSPTGLVMRFGMFFFAIAAALAIFAVSRRSEDDEESSIA